LQSQQNEQDSQHFFNVLENQLAAIVQLTHIDYAAIYLSNTDHTAGLHRVADSEGSDCAYDDSDEGSMIGIDDENYSSDFEEKLTTDRRRDRSGRDEANEYRRRGYYTMEEYDKLLQVRETAQLLYQYPQSSDLGVTDDDLYEGSYEDGYGYKDDDDPYDPNQSRSSGFIGSNRDAIDSSAYTDSSDDEIANLWKSYDSANKANEQRLDKEKSVASHDATSVKPSAMKFPIEYGGLRVGFLNAVSREPLFWSRIPDAHLDLIEALSIAIGIYFQRRLLTFLICLWLFLILHFLCEVKSYKYLIPAFFNIRSFNFFTIFYDVFISNCKSTY
jgi:hypothetical protein